jgi:hypothetical protein
MKTISQTLPAMSREDALKCDVPTRCDWYATRQVRHHLHDLAATFLTELLSQPESIGIIGVVGMASIGKTTITQRFADPKMHVSVYGQCPPSEIPVLRVEALASSDRAFSWGSLLRHILIAGNEPLIDAKMRSVVINGCLQYDSGVSSTGRRMSVANLRDAVSNMLRHRRVRVLIIDEAFHVSKFSRDSASMDVLRALADEAGTQVVLVGPYGLATMLEDGGQVARRSELIHFKRYRRNDDKDVREFARIISKLQLAWPSDQRPDLEQYAPEILDACAGSVGMLKVMMQSLLWQHLTKGKPPSQLLSRAFKAPRKIASLRQSAERGEAAIEGLAYGEDDRLPWKAAA